MTAKNLALAKITGALRTASRSFGEMMKDVYNVKDYGAKGDFGTNDTAAIQACIDAAGTAGTGGAGIGGTVFFPPGGYIVGPATIGAAYGINISGTGGNFSGRIIGSGRGPTFIQGNVPNGFTFMQGNGGGGNGPSEIAHMSLTNNSQIIGSGALCIGNGSAHIHDCGFGGMINVYLPFNIYDMVIESCGGGANMVGSLAAGGSGYIGTLGVAGYAPHIFGWRSTTNFQTCFQLFGSNGSMLIGNGIENCEVAMMLGMATGWASHCTVADDILTVGGMINTGDPYIGAGGMHMFMTGLPMKAWGEDPNDNSTGTSIMTDGTPSITDGTTTLSGSTMTVNSVPSGGYGLRVGALVEGTGVIAGTLITAVPGGINNNTGNYTVTPGGQSAGPTTITSTDSKAGVKLTGLSVNGVLGTYRISNGGHSITTPVPIWTRFDRTWGGVVQSFQNEACHYGLYCNSLGGSTFTAIGGNSAANEATGQYGQVGWTPHSGFYIRSVGASTFLNCSSTANANRGGWYFPPSGGGGNSTFISCLGQKTADNVVTATISNGAGGAGTVLYVTGFPSGSGIGIGLTVTGPGVTAGTRIVGSQASEPPVPCSISIASPAVVTTSSAHGLSANDAITFDVSSLPTGLSSATTYYVITSGMTSTTFKVSASAGPGAAVNTTAGTAGGHNYAKINGSNGLTAYNNVGTYRVNISQSSSPTGLNYGPDWVFPTATEQFAALQFINCGSVSPTVTSLISLAGTFNSLPKESGASGFILRPEGVEFSITDGQKSTGGAAAFGDIVIGGSTGHYKVRWNGTNWTRCG